MIGSRDPEVLAGEVLCIVMVETREALERVDGITNTPGVDGTYIGPSGLALSLGLEPPLNVQDGEHEEAVERIRNAGHRHRIAARIHSASGGSARGHAEAGFDMVTVASDAALLRDAARREMIVARGGRGP